MKALSADAPTGSPLDSQPMPRDGHVLDDVLMRQVQDRPEALALQFEGRAFSYGRLARRTERAAARLWHPWGVRTGDRVAYLGLNHVDQITLLFALARTGAVLVPLNFRLAPAEWQAARHMPSNHLPEGPPLLAEDCAGHIESWSVGYRRGAAADGYAFVRTASGARALAKCRAGEAVIFAARAARARGRHRGRPRWCPRSPRAPARGR